VVIDDVTSGTLTLADGLTIQVAAFRELDRAAAVTQQLRGAGLPASGVWNRAASGIWSLSAHMSPTRRRNRFSKSSPGRVSARRKSYAKTPGRCCHEAFAAAFIACMLLLQGSNSFAADPSVMRVAVVPSAGQMSLVIELSDEARSVSTEQVTPTLLMVEAGPIALPLKRQILNAPSGLELVQKVSVDEGTTAGKEHVLRLGVT
jgi:hypothetical protein